MDELKIILGSLILILLLDSCSYNSYNKSEPQYYQRYIYEFPEEAYINQGLIGMWYNEIEFRIRYNKSAVKYSTSSAVTKESRISYANSANTRSETRRKDSRVRTKDRESKIFKTRKREDRIQTKQRKSTKTKIRRTKSPVRWNCKIVTGSESHRTDSEVRTRFIEFTPDGQVIYVPNLRNPNSTEYWGEYKTLYDTLYVQFNIGERFSESLEVFVFEFRGSSLYFKRVEKYGNTNRLFKISGQEFESDYTYY